ncbi:hypothetical protein, partial [Xanthomonas campestris]|uniref:hypothetical protein n=1 Tax=Xanthomonas campestris TaxID=339 RepID=UPI0039C07F17
ARVGLFDKPDDLLGAESALLHVRPLGFTDFIASAGTAQWGQVNGYMQWFNVNYLAWSQRSSRFSLARVFRSQAPAALATLEHRRGTWALA